MRSALVSVLLLSACATSAGVDSQPEATSTSVLAAVPEVTIGVVTADDDATADTAGPDETTAVTAAVPAVLPQGFATTQALVTKADGTTCELCLWVADTAELRSQGLMFVTDVGSADGMAFLYPNPHTGRFWMRNTVLPLSIAFFASDGVFMGDFDMEPCTTDPCPRYTTPRDFLVAVEVPQGDLDAAGLVTGSRLELLDIPCGE